jgi:putative ABC transport system ATP-binding protein
MLTRRDSAERSILLKLQKLRKEFTEGNATRVILNEVDTSFNQGEFVVLLGRSGSGKSTLLNLISGIEQPSAGTIWINDVPITQLNERSRTLFRRDRIGFIFQFFNLIPTLTVLENVTLPQELAGQNRKDVEQKALNLLERVGLADRCQAFPDKLSGGQQQRVAIARALIHDLDEETGDRVLKLLLDLTRSANKTLIMATHNPEIAKLADRVLRVHDGHLEEEAIQRDTTQEVAA